MDASLVYLYNLGESYRGLFLAFFFLAGLAAGSFANVCIYRLPQGKSLVSPRSFCPKCQKPIRWFDNIPVISYLVLRGKCRDCHGSIPPGYFFVELFSGIVFAGLFLYSGVSPELIWVFYFIISLLILSVIDLKQMTIPDEVTLTGILAGWFFALAFPEIFGETSRRMALGESTLGVIAGGGLVWAVATAGDFLFKRESMGGGDLKLVAMIGAFLGWEGAVLTFFLAPFFALPYGLYQKWIRKSNILAYGPFLAMAGIFNLFFADRILGAILNR